jgi:hypothetical protein
MTELSREARAVLSAGLNADGPSAERRQRVKTRLLATVGGGTLALGGAASAATAGPALASGAVVAKGLGAGVLLLWFGAGAALGVGASGVVAVAARQAPGVAASVAVPARKAPTPLPSGTAPKSGPELAVAPSALAEVAPVAGETRDSERGSGAEARGSVRAPNAANALLASPAAPAASVSTLSEEAALLQRAERAIAEKRPGLALAILAEHERRFSNGALGEEREVARVLALCALGRVSEAQHRARAFVDASPRSVLVPRLEQSCAATDPTRANSGVAR